MRLDGDVADVRVLIGHPMETGLRKDPQTNEPVPIHFIKTVTATLNGTPVMQAQWSRAFKGGAVAACVRKVQAKNGKALTPDELADMEAFLVAHAADSDQPETCGQ